MSQKESFKDNINNIITDLLNEGTYTDFMELQDNKTCHAHTIFLEQELEQRFDKLQLKEFGSQLLFISPHKYEPCKTENCDGADEQMQKKKYGVEGNLKSKAQICRAISVYYVRIFNILAAIMVAIDPENNMCIRRMRALYKNINEDTFKVEICGANKELYPEDIMKVEGIQELVALYQMYNVEGMEEQNEKVRLQIEQLQKKINEYFNAKTVQESNLKNEGINLGNNEENNNIEDTEERLNTALANNRKKQSGNNNRKNKQANPLGDNKRNQEPKAETSGNNNRNKQGTPVVANNRNQEPKGVPVGTNNRNQEPKGVPAGANNRKNNQGAPPGDMPVAPPGGMPVAPPGDMPVAPPGDMPVAPPGGMPVAQPGLNIAESSDEAIGMRGGRRTVRKNRRGIKKTKKQRGGGILDNMFGFFTGGKKESNPMEPNLVPVVEGTQSVIVARENLKTIQDFRKFMETKRAGYPKDMIKDGSPLKLKGRPEDFSKSVECKATGDEAVDREIKKTDKSFAAYIDNYNNMNAHYKTSKEALKEILMSIIEKSKTNNKFKLKNISSAELSQIEDKTREILLNYYSKCQELFTEGFDSLNEGIDNAEIAKKESLQRQEVEKLKAAKEAKRRNRTKRASE